MGDAAAGEHSLVVGNIREVEGNTHGQPTTSNPAEEIAGRPGTEEVDNTHVDFANSVGGGDDGESELDQQASNTGQGPQTERNAGDTYGRLKVVQ